MLCLPSGERIKVRDNTKLIFELTDLSQATPSTISRCGVVYAQDELIEYENVARYYLDRGLKKTLPQEYIDHLKKWVVIACAKGFPYLEKVWAFRWNLIFIWLGLVNK